MYLKSYFLLKFPSKIVLLSTTWFKKFVPIEENIPSGKDDKDEKDDKDIKDVCSQKSKEDKVYAVYNPVRSYPKYLIKYYERKKKNIGKS